MVKLSVLLSGNCAEWLFVFLHLCCISNVVMVTENSDICVALN